MTQPVIRGPASLPARLPPLDPPPSYRPLIAATLSALLPGAGQWYAGRRRRAAVFAAGTVALVVPAGAVAILVVRGGAAAGLSALRPFFANPGLLWWVLGLEIGVGLYRLAAAADAFTAATDHERRSHIAAVMTTTVLVLTVAMPHLWAAERITALHALLSFDYGTSAQPAAPFVIDAVPAPRTTIPRSPGTTMPATTSTEPPTVTTTAPTVTTTFVGTSSIEAPMTPTVPPIASTTTAPVDPIDRRLNVLLLGGDAGPDRTGVRTDTMMVVSIDRITGDAAMFAIPRNMRQVPLPPSHPAYDRWPCHCYPALANTVYQWGLNEPDLFPGGPNPGANAAVSLLSFLFGIEIHGYAYVDLLGFVDVVDALGGLDIEVLSPITDGLYTRPGGDVVPVAYTPGTHHMDGEEALAFARVRRDSDDYVRMGRQRCVVQAIAAQADAVTLINELPALVPALQGSLLTDFPVAEWPDLIELAAAADTENIVSVRFIPAAPELAGTGRSYNAGWVGGGYPTPNVDLIRQTVQAVLAAPADQTLDTLGIEALSDICGAG